MKQECYAENSLKAAFFDMNNIAMKAEIIDCKIVMVTLIYKRIILDYHRRPVLAVFKTVGNHSMCAIFLDNQLFQLVK